MTAFPVVTSSFKSLASTFVHVLPFKEIYASIALITLDISSAYSGIIVISAVYDHTSNGSRITL